MKFSAARVEALSNKLIDHLLKEGYIAIDTDSAAIQRTLAAIIVKELQVEDHLNIEVREIMKKHACDLNQGKIDNKTMFQLIKKQLVKERDLVL